MRSSKLCSIPSATDLNPEPSLLSFEPVAALGVNLNFAVLYTLLRIREAQLKAHLSEATRLKTTVDVYCSSVWTRPLGMKVTCAPVTCVNLPPHWAPAMSTAKVQGRSLDMKSSACSAALVSQDIGDAVNERFKDYACDGRPRLES